MTVVGANSFARTHEVAAELARSWLLVPGSRPELFGPAMDFGADQVVLDIEDAVDPTAKGVARSDVVAWLDSGASAWVRVNDRDSEFWGDDVDALKRKAYSVSRLVVGIIVETQVRAQTILLCPTPAPAWSSPAVSGNSPVQSMAQPSVPVIRFSASNRKWRSRTG